jgi:hypothetical protein
MQLAVRSYLAAGVAFAGVGALVVSPVAPPMPDIKVLPAHSSAAVELSALVNPFAEYAEAFSAAFQNLQAIGVQIGQDPAPILSQIVKNQLSSAVGVGIFVQAFGNSLFGAFAETPQELHTALGQFAAGDVTAALNTLLNTALGPVVQAVFDNVLLNPDIYAGFQNAIRQPVANLLNVIDLASPTGVLNLLGPLLAPVQVLTDVTNAFGAAGDGIFAGIKTGNLEEVANALLSLGPDVTYAILNGSQASGAFGAGLFGPNGIVKGLLTIRDLIAAAITPAPASSALAAVTATRASATTVTLKLAPGAKSIKAAKAPAETAGEASAETPATAGAVAAPKKVNPIKAFGDGIRAALTGKSPKPTKPKPSTTSGRSTAKSGKSASSGAGAAG